MPDTIQSKRAMKVFSEIEDSGLKEPDFILLANSTKLDNSFFYLADLAEGLFEESYLIARMDGSLSILTSPMERLLVDPDSGIDVTPYRKGPEAPAKLKNLVKAKVSDFRLIGLNYSELTVESFEKIKSIFKDSEFLDISRALARARLIKDQSEIIHIKRACDIGSKMYDKIPDFLSEGVTESEIAASMAFEMQKNGSGSLPFDTIVGFGRNSAFPHHSAGPTKLKKNDFVLLDYGAKDHGYCSDITRTLVFGRASNIQQDMYETVLEANMMGIELCTPDNIGEEVNTKIGEFLESRAFKVIHGFGHSIGRSVHDGYALDNNPEKLKPGMVITVEPAVYKSGLGGVRIEDDVLITRGRPRVLTSPKKELIEVGA
jgi:Xaa-Pro dipeptidase